MRAGGRQEGKGNGVAAVRNGEALEVVVAVEEQTIGVDVSGVEREDVGGVGCDGVVDGPIARRVGAVGAQLWLDERCLSWHDWGHGIRCGMGEEHAGVADCELRGMPI